MIKPTPSVKLVDAQGARICDFGELDVTLRIGHKVFMHRYVVAEIEAHMILGLDFLREHKSYIDAGEHEVDFDHNGSDYTHNDEISVSTVNVLPSPAEALQPLTDLLNRGSEYLSSSQKSQVWDLLLEFKDVFSLNSSDIGRTSLVQHSIDTGQDRPIKQAPRHLPLAKQDWAKQELKSMSDQGIIEPVYGP